MEASEIRGSESLLRQHIHSTAEPCSMAPPLAGPSSPSIDQVDQVAGTVRGARSSACSYAIASPSSSGDSARPPTSGTRSRRRPRLSRTAMPEPSASKARLPAE